MERTTKELKMAMSKEKMLIELERHFKNCVEQGWITKGQKADLLIELRCSPYNDVLRKAVNCGINICTQ